MQDAQQGHQRGRLNRWVLRFAAVAAVFVLVYLALSWFFKSDLERRLADLRAAGEPTSIAELAPPPLPDEQNAAVHLQVLAPELGRFEADYSAFCETPLGIAHMARGGRGAPPTAEQVHAIKEILAKHEGLVQGIEQVARCEGYASLRDYTLDHPTFLSQLIKSGPPSRTVARYLKWKMEVLTVDGDPEAAVKVGVELLRFTRLIDNEPTLVQYLIATACRWQAVVGLNQALRSGEITPATRTALTAELALHAPSESLTRALRVERAVSLSALRDMGGAGVKGRLFSWYFARSRSALLDFYEEQLPLAAQPWYQSHEAMNDAEAVAKYPALVQMLAPSLQAAHQTSNRDLARIRCLGVVNALGAFRDAHGQETTGLADLDLAEAATVDPFSGKPLIVTATDNGWLVYSVFENGTDDGGDFSNRKDVGFGPVPADLDPASGE